MGFYNPFKLLFNLVFYKVRKKYFKILFIVLLFICILFLYNKYVNGFSYVYDDETINLPDFPSQYDLQYKLILKKGNGEYHAFVSAYQIYCDYPYNNNNGQARYTTSGYFENPQDYDKLMYHIKLSNNAWVGFNDSIIEVTNSIPSLIQYSNFNLTDYSGAIIVPEYQEPFQKPIFYNKTDIENNNFDNVVIKLNDYNYESNLYFSILKDPINTGTIDNQIVYYYSADVFTLNYTTSYYITNAEGEKFYKISKSELNLLPNKQYYFIITTDNITFYNTHGVYDYTNDENAYDGFSFNTENSITEGQVTNNLLENQQNQINKQIETMENIENSINSDNVESSPTDLPSTDVESITQNGIDNIFTSIYNAFCVGEPQDIVFPIPYTNKNITLSPYYVRDMLNNNGASWVYLFIQAFWGYLIGRFIIKDITKKITKIKSGNIENLENENIKEEML